MFNTIAELHPRDKDLPERAWTLGIYQSILDGKLYDRLPYEFWQAQTDAGEPISLSQRKPSVRYNLCRLVVQDSVSMLFGDQRFPSVDCEDEPTRETLAELIKESRLNALMMDVALRGSVGSVAVLMRVLKGKVYFQRLDTNYLSPEWDPEAPDTLKTITQKYKVKGKVLAQQGYTIKTDNLETDFWFCRQWDDAAETWFVPWTKAEEAKDGFAPQIDKDRTVEHALGFVPLVWIRNLPGGDEIDGACTFSQAIHTAIEIDYQTSQAGRGLKYSSDPELMLKDPAMGDSGEILKGAGNAIVVSEKGDAKWLEIKGDAVGAVIEYVKMLRELAIESIRGNRGNADKLGAAQSGRALELLHQPLIWLAGELRISYGEEGLLPLLRMVIAASRKVEIIVGGNPVEFSDEPLSLRWSPYFHSTDRDKVEQANALKTLRDGGNLSREVAVKTLATNYDVEDVQAELARIAADEQEAMQRAIDEAAQIQVKNTGDAAA